jgi:hypothetical protein
MLRARTLWLLKPLVFGGSEPTILEVPSVATVRIALFERSKNLEDNIGFDARDHEDFQLCAENARACAWALCDEKRVFKGQSVDCFDKEIVEVLIAMCLKFGLEKGVPKDKLHALEGGLYALVTWDRARVVKLLIATTNP